MDTPLPSNELPVEDLSEVSDLAERSRNQIKIGSLYNEDMDGRRRPFESHLNSAGVAGHVPIPDLIAIGDLQTSGINGFPQPDEDNFRLARPHPVVGSYMLQEEAWEALQMTTLPLADERKYGSFVSPISSEDQMITDCTKPT